MQQHAPAGATPPDPQANQQHDPQPAAAPPSEGQRDAQGRFAAGNRGGPGNPFARQTAGLRKALVNAVSEKDIADIAAVLLDKARQGDVAACKLVFSYTLGKPTAATDPDTLDQQEMHTLANNHVGMEEVQRVANLLPVGLVLAFLHSILPYLEKAKAMQWHDLWQHMGAKMDQEHAEDAADESAEEEAAGAPVAPSEAEPETLEQTLRAWQAEATALKARLSPTQDGIEPAKRAAPEESRNCAEDKPRRPSRQRQEQTEEVSAGCPSRGRGLEGYYRPSKNGSNRQAADSASDNLPDNNRC